MERDIAHDTDREEATLDGDDRVAAVRAACELARMGPMVGAVSITLGAAGSPGRGQELLRRASATLANDGLRQRIELRGSRATLHIVRAFVEHDLPDEAAVQHALVEAGSADSSVDLRHRVHVEPE